MSNSDVQNLDNYLSRLCDTCINSIPIQGGIRIDNKNNSYTYISIKNNLYYIQMSDKKYTDMNNVKGYKISKLNTSYYDLRDVEIFIKKEYR